MSKSLRILTVTLTALSALAARAQETPSAARDNDTVKVVVYFDTNSTQFKKDQAWESTKVLLDIMKEPPVSIDVIGYACPLSMEDDGEALSLRRAHTLADEIRMIYGDVTANKRGYGEDWQGLTDCVNANFKNSEAQLRIIEDARQFIKDSEGHIDKDRLRQLIALSFGSDYRTYEKGFFPILRRAEAELVFRKTNAADIKDENTVAFAFMNGTRTENRARMEKRKNRPDTEEPPQVRKVKYAVHTSLLLPPSSVGLEIPLGGHLTAGADWYSPWLWPRMTSNRNCLEFQAADICLRWYLRPCRQEGYTGNTLLGHSLSAGAFAGHYDLEWNYKGTQGELYGFYAGYGYSVRIWKNFRLLLDIGFGWAKVIHREYTVYTTGGKLIRNTPYDKIKNWTGPTKIGITLVIPITRKEAGREN